MKTVGIACNTLKDEIMMVVKEFEIDYPILWIVSGMHTTPEKLNKAIQSQIDCVGNVDDIILLFGSCGNCLHGLKSDEARIIFPRVDDCISLFLGGNPKKAELEKEGHSYYITKGYLESEANIWTDYTRTVARHGEEKATRIMRLMLKNYQKLRIIDTGAFDLEDFVEETKPMAAKLELEHEVIPGALNILVKALRGQWDEDFVTIQPGESVNYAHLGFGV